MNRFAIEENDQFEIHVKDYKDQNGLYKEDIYNAAKEVLLKAQRGLGYYRLLVTFIIHLIIKLDEINKNKRRNVLCAAPSFSSSPWGKVNTTQRGRSARYISSLVYVY